MSMLLLCTTYLKSDFSFFYKSVEVGRHLVQPPTQAGPPRAN